MGYADVGFHGCKDIPTPNLDALAASGVRFTSGYVSGPYCSPTRAGLLTGRYQQRFGHEFNPDRAGQGLPLTEKTIADHLKAAGYATGLVGKWHLGSQPEMHPQKRGFEEFYGFLAGSHSYFKSEGMLRGTEPAEEKEYFTDAFAREGSAFIERHKKDPWFLYLAFNAVHTPMQADDARLAKFSHIADKKRQTYAAMMFALDEGIGRILKTLAATGQEQETLVIFLSDNGGPTMPGVTVNGSSNGELRGSKRTTLEGGVRVPMIVAWKNHLKPLVYDQSVIQLDLTATAFELAGLKVKNLDGVNLIPFISGKKDSQSGKTPHDALYWRFGEQMAIRTGDYKLVRYDSNVDTRTGAKRQPVSALKLYDLGKDIGETHDLADKMPEKARELQAKWDRWNATLIKPLWGEGKAAGDTEEENTKKKKRSK